MEIAITAQERDLMVDLMNAWEDGMDLAIEEMTKDPMFKEVEELLEVVGSVEEDRCLLRSVREKLRSAPSSNTA